MKSPTPFTGHTTSSRTAPSPRGGGHHGSGGGGGYPMQVRIGGGYDGSGGGGGGALGGEMIESAFNRASPKLTQIFVGGLRPTDDDKKILHVFRNYGPLFHIHRPQSTFAFITLFQTQGNAAVKMARNIFKGIRVDLANNPTPQYPSVFIEGDGNVCRAYLIGHCKPKCPLGFNHPLHRCDVDYEEKLSGRKSKKQKLNFSQTQSMTTAMAKAPTSTTTTHLSSSIQARSIFGASNFADLHRSCEEDGCCDFRTDSFSSAASLTTDHMTTPSISFVSSPDQATSVPLTSSTDQATRSTLMANDDETSICSSGSYDSTDPYLFGSDAQPRYDARKYYNIWKRSVRRDGKADKLTKEQAIKLLEGECFFCARKHIRGKNHLNSIDRIDSSRPIYSLDNCISACAECNSMKLWLPHSELFEVIYQWNQDENRKRILRLCPRIGSIDELDMLAASESDGSCVKIQGTGSMSDFRKGFDLLMEDDATRPIVQQIMLSPCEYCGQNIAWGVDRFDSNESYIKSLQNGRLFGCCTPCNIFKGSNDFEKVFIHTRRIYQNMNSPAWLTKDRPPNEKLAKYLLSKDLLPQTLAFGHQNRKPVKIEIGTQIIVSPSVQTLKRFMLAASVDGGCFHAESASIAEYRRSLESSSSRVVCEAFGISPDPVNLDNEMLLKLTDIEARAENLAKMLSERMSKLPSDTSTRGKVHHMSFKNRRVPSGSNDLDNMSSQESDLDHGDDLSSGTKQLIVYKSSTETVAERVKKRCVEYMLDDFQVQSFEDTPFHESSASK
eukprot:scaffold4869_cov249-Skeletonema_menzelii.AAC.1